MLNFTCVGQPSAPKEYLQAYLRTTSRSLVIPCFLATDVMVNTPPRNLEVVNPIHFHGTKTIIGISWNCHQRFFASFSNQPKQPCRRFPWRITLHQDFTIVCVQWLEDAESITRHDISDRRRKSNFKDKCADLFLVSRQGIPKWAQICLLGWSKG